MLQVSGVTKAFGGQSVLDGISFSLSPGERAALIGPNGCGKSTLLRIIAGFEEADSGSVTLQPGARAGYLGQEGQLEPGRTLYEEMAEVFSDIFEMERKLRDMEQAMADLEGPELERCLADYSAVQARYEHAEAHTVDARILTVLAGLGFEPGDAERPCREFSGGWQMRGALAQLLLRSPDLLLLDEPTNHLDVTAVEWLEEYLTEYKGLVLLVSHDRAFLDRAISRTLEIRNTELHDYAGNYTFYQEEKELRRDRQRVAHQTQQRKISHAERFVERFRAKATLASRVKSREKMLEKMERIEAPEAEPDRIRVGFVPASRSGRELLTVKELSKAYGDRNVLEGVDFTLEREQRLAVVGKNGSGKSTLLRLLMDQEEPDGGSVGRGLRLTIGYFAQHQAEALDPERTALEEVEAVAPPGTTHTRIRTLLGCLLFRGEDCHKKVAVLSGGERSRVALARCILQPTNLLLLDEPTNHLDLMAREWLLGALNEYPGAILLVTHDRHFINGLVDRVLELEDGRSRLFLGNYDHYRQKKFWEGERVRKAAEAAREQARKSAPKHRRPAQRAPVKVTWKLDALEARIFELEAELEQLAQQLADPALYQDAGRATETQAEYERLASRCEELTALWDEMTA